MRKKVLIITYYWPPAGGPGVQRAVYFVKYLRSFGWEPIVYTVKDGEYPNLDPSFEKEIPENLTVWKRRSPEPYYWYKLLTGRKKDESLKPAIVSETSKKSFTHQMAVWIRGNFFIRSEEHTSELQSRGHLVCRLLLEKKKKQKKTTTTQAVQT